jgi:hypothetical protein
MTAQTYEPFKVNEGSGASLAFQLSDKDGNNVQLVNLDTFTLYVYDHATQSIINSRSGVDAINANNVTVSGTGAVEYSMQEDDNAIVGGTPVDSYEEHRVYFRWTLVSGLPGSREFRVKVKNLGKKS